MKTNGLRRHPAWLALLFALALAAPACNRGAETDRQADLDESRQEPAAAIEEPSTIVEEAPVEEPEAVEEETAPGRGLAEAPLPGEEGGLRPSDPEQRPRTVIEAAPAPRRSERSRELEERERRLAEREAEIAAREERLRREAEERRAREREAEAEREADVAEVEDVEVVEEPEPEPEPEPRIVRATLQAGTVLDVELEEEVSSRSSSVGDTFRARVAQDVYEDGVLAIPAGSDVVGEVTKVVPLRRVGGRATLGLRFTDLVLPSGETVPIDASLVEQGKSETKRDAATIGGAAAGGAILGRILNKGDKSKGSVIGAIIGAAAGTVIASRTPGEDVTFPEGAVISLRLDSPAEIRRRERR